jgi:glycosyltransferase involved in cell wall biosynthesis
MKKIWVVIKFYFSKLFHCRGYDISIIVPFHASDPNNQRAKNWAWLHQYWHKQLPGAEIIIGTDNFAIKNNKPFSKSCAVNNAVRKSHGKILVIVDADGYISINDVLECAKEIRLAEKKKRHLWFVPYRKFFRLTEEATLKILQTNPADKHNYKKPELNEILNMEQFNGISGSAYGHWYGALIQIMSRNAFDIVGGWDERFRGWGGEDHAAMRAMDTLYGPHKTLPGLVIHLWHPFTLVKSKNPTKSKNRLWDNQEINNSNDNLSHRYYWSNGNINRMRKLVDEWKSIKFTLK